MGKRTGRKTPADKATREKALKIARDNPEMPAAAVAQRIGVTARQVQYWISQAAKKSGEGPSDGK